MWEVYYVIGCILVPSKIASHIMIFTIINVKLEICKLSFIFFHFQIIQSPLECVNIVIVRLLFSDLPTRTVCTTVEVQINMKPLNYFI